jgi:prepilin-type N-terminal cleavage/methylation domain-containing protein
MNSSERSTPRLHATFTLVEMMLVVMVIGVLVSIGFTTIREVQRNSQINQTATQIRNVYQAIEAFKAEQGIYPQPHRDGDIVKDEILAQIAKHYSYQTKELDPQGRLLDGYGNPLRYIYNKPTDHHGNTHETTDSDGDPLPSMDHEILVYSTGPDGKSGEESGAAEDDIYIAGDNTLRQGLGIDASSTATYGRTNN